MLTNELMLIVLISSPNCLNVDVMGRHSNRVCCQPRRLSRINCGSICSKWILDALQIYSSVEAAQMQPIEKPMYRSGRFVTLLILHSRNPYRFIHLPKPPNWSRLKNQCIGVGQSVTFNAAFLRPVQVYSSAEAAQMKPIEQRMYCSGWSVTLWTFYSWNPYRLIRKPKPSNWRPLNKFIKVSPTPKLLSIKF